MGDPRGAGGVSPIFPFADADGLRSGADHGGSLEAVPSDAGATTQALVGSEAMTRCTIGSTR